jgi:hypothetical protein
VTCKANGCPCTYELAQNKKRRIANTINQRQSSLFPPAEDLSLASLVAANRSPSQLSANMLPMLSGQTSMQPDLAGLEAFANRSPASAGPSTLPASVAFQEPSLDFTTTRTSTRLFDPPSGRLALPAIRIRSLRDLAPISQIRSWLKLFFVSSSSLFDVQFDLFTGSRSSSYARCPPTYFHGRF